MRHCFKSRCVTAPTSSGVRRLSGARRTPGLYFAGDKHPSLTPPAPHSTVVTMIAEDYEDLFHLKDFSSHVMKISHTRKLFGIWRHPAPWRNGVADAVPAGGRTG